MSNIFCLLHNPLIILGNSSSLSILINLLEYVYQNNEKQFFYNINIYNLQHLFTGFELYLLTLPFRLSTIILILFYFEFPVIVTLFVHAFVFKDLLWKCLLNFRIHKLSFIILLYYEQSPPIQAVNYSRVLLLSFFMELLWKANEKTFIFWYP